MEESWRKNGRETETEGEESGREGEIETEGKWGKRGAGIEKKRQSASE